MIRRLAIAAALAAALVGVGAGTASALPVESDLPTESTQAYWACVAILPLDTGYCVSNPFDSLP